MILYKFAIDLLKTTALLICADVVGHQGKKAFHWVYSEYYKQTEDTNE